MRRWSAISSHSFIEESINLPDVPRSPVRAPVPLPARRGAARGLRRAGMAGMRFGMLVAGAAAPLAAQSPGGFRSLADAAGSDAVQQRGRPAYDAIGIDVGGFRLMPTARARVSYDDNIFNSGAVRLRDTVFTLRPAATLASQWSRHGISIAADASIERYARNSIANADQYGVTANGRYDVSRSVVLGLVARHARMVEPRGTLGEIAIGGEPSRYDTDTATATATLLLPLVNLAASAGLSRVDYSDVRLGDGATLSQSFRDRRQHDLGLRADVPIGPGLRLFASGSWNDQRYGERIGGIDQDSRGYNLLGGIGFGVTDLISGEVGLGYIAQRYRQPGFGTIGGLSYNARMTWNPTRLTTVSLRANRAIQQSPFIDQSGVTQDRADLTADHELLRNLILSATAGLVRERYEAGRTDRRFSLNAGARLLVNRGLELGVEAGHRRQTSSGRFARPYGGSSVSVSILLKQ